MVPKSIWGLRQEVAFSQNSCLSVSCVSHRFHWGLGSRKVRRSVAETTIGLYAAWVKAAQTCHVRRERREGRREVRKRCKGAEWGKRITGPLLTLWRQFQCAVLKHFPHHFYFPHHFVLKQLRPTENSQVVQWTFLHLFPRFTASQHFAVFLFFNHTYFFLNHPKVNRSDHDTFAVKTSLIT